MNFETCGILLGELIPLSKQCQIELPENFEGGIIFTQNFGHYKDLPFMIKQVNLIGELFEKKMKTVIFPPETYSLILGKIKTFASVLQEGNFKTYFTYLGSENPVQINTVRDFFSLLRNVS
jgi:hypothetical protein